MATPNQVHYHEHLDEPAAGNSVWAIALVVLAVIALLIWGYGYSDRRNTDTTNNNTINTPAGDTNTTVPSGTGAGTTP